MGGSSLFSEFFLIATIFLLFNINISATCISSEKQALLDFKKDLIDPSGRLSSWKDDADCCQWQGVVCGNKSGHVIQLRLRNAEFHDESALGGRISRSLQNLTHLRFLDLSENDFGGIPIPSFFGSLKSLRYLNLSGAGFQGMVPYELGNLSSLRTLSVSGYESLYRAARDKSAYVGDLQVDNLQWLVGLSNLEHLDLSYVDLISASNWLEVINMISSLVELHLSFCEIIHISQLIHTNFSSLTVLDLSMNYLRGSIPTWIFGLTALVSLDLSWNHFDGPLPRGSSWNLTSLTHLDLSFNRYLNGSLPDELTNLNNLVSLNLAMNCFEGLGRVWNWSSLISLDLTHNNLTGTLPESVVPLSKLEYLYIADNLMEGIVNERLLDNLPSLKVFDASRNSLTLKVSASWIPRAQFNTLGLDSWKVGPQFPTWLRSQKYLSDLNLSSTGISDTIPPWLFNSSILQSIDLSHNQLHGGISHFLCEVKNETRPLGYLDLRENSLSGEILDCWMNYPSVYHINLNSNNFTGSIPRSLFYLEHLDYLKLSNNSLTGTIPLAL